MAAARARIYRSSRSAAIRCAACPSHFSGGCGRSLGALDSSDGISAIRAGARPSSVLVPARTVTGLVMADANDWYRFTTTATGTSTSRVGINFSHAQGDLDIRLYNSAGVQIGV